MKIIKTIFLIAMFNFFLVCGIVLATKNMTTTKIVASRTLPVIAESTVPTETIAITPKLTPTIVKIIKKVIAEVDPFAVLIKSGGVTTIKPNNSSPNTTSNTIQPTNPPPLAQPTIDSRCIISIDGKRYDVTVFRIQHSGGDIFNCGSDMSAIFHGQHSNSMLQRMDQYLI
ncbi:hypothetical protein KBC75_04145 [Candidatus Shapirobacteria bacterium]|nr:hypothetical protein [Candidatus Shapirobacteria bacterium]